MKRLKIYILIILAVMMAAPAATLAGGQLYDDAVVVDEPVISEPTPEPVVTATPAPPDDPDPSEDPVDTTTVMHIDNVNVYSGMDRPYTSGYMPSASGGQANIVLPLLSDYSIMRETVNVSFDLGTPGDSPFVFGNYDQTISKMVHQTASGSKEAYLINVVLPLSSKRAMGSYPVIMKINGYLSDGTPFAQEFTVYTTINDGTDPDATPTPEPEAAQPTEEKPLPQPKIMLVNYTVDPSPIEAGDTFHLNATLVNTDENQALNNVLITIAGETTDLLPTGAETGNFYFKKIGAGETVSVEMDMIASASIKAEPQKLGIKVEYEGSKASSTAFSAADSIVVPVLQPIRLEYDDPTIPESLNAGDTVSISLNVMNLGLGTVHNVRMSLTAPGLEPDKTAFLGNIESGASKKGDLYVFVGTLDIGGESLEEETVDGGAAGEEETLMEDAVIPLDGEGDVMIESGSVTLDEAGDGAAEDMGMDEMGGESVEDMGMDGMNGEEYLDEGMTGGGDAGKYGDTSGIVLLQYEDEYGTEYREEFPFTSYINPPVIMAPEVDETEEPEQQALPQWWISVAIAGAIVVVILIVRGAAKAKEKRRRELEESGFKDEDD